MAPLTDPIRRAAYLDALGNWNHDNYIEFELTESAFKWVKRELDGATLKQIRFLMFDYVSNGAEIDEVRETREEWCDEYEFHYDLRLTIGDRPVYIETRLRYREPFVADESSILVVNIHEP